MKERADGREGEETKGTARNEAGVMIKLFYSWSRSALRRLFGYGR
jgi:hypothetical protein